MNTKAVAARRWLRWIGLADPTETDDQVPQGDVGINEEEAEIENQGEGEAAGVAAAEVQARQETVTKQTSPGTTAEPSQRDAVEPAWESGISCWDFALGKVGLPSGGASRYPWISAFATSVLFAILYAVFWVVCNGFRFMVTYSAFWPPTGLVVGVLISMNYRIRWIFPPLSFLAAFVIRTFYLNRPAIPSAAFAADMVLETVGIALVTIGLASFFSKRPGVAVDLSNGFHVLAFFIGCCWSFIAALVRLSIIITYTTYEWPSFGDSYLNVLDVATICVVAPFIISIVYERPNIWRHCFDHPYTAVLYVVDLALIVCLPLLSHAILKGYTLFPFMAGLYITFPLINVFAPKVGVVGVSFAFLLAGISAGATAIGRWHTLSPEEQQAAQFTIRDQLLWIQLFLYILVFSSLAFVSVIKDRERAREGVEETVAVRTEQLRQALALVEKERTAAQAASRAKGIFLGFLAHELRNPLHAISNLAETLVENSETSSLSSTAISPALAHAQALLFSAIPGHRPGTSQQASENTQDGVGPSAKSIDLCAKYMLSLVSDVLDIETFEEGTVKLQPKICDLHGLLDGQVAMCTASAKQYGVIFQGSVSESVPKMVELDSARLLQAIGNIFNNCVRHTPEGGHVSMTIDVESSFAQPRKRPSGPSQPPSRPSRSLVKPERGPKDSITIEMRGLKNNSGTPSVAGAEKEETDKVTLVICCSDTGPGMSEKQVDELFRPYVLGTANHLKEYSGSGLGLAISNQIVKLMGGWIGVESEPGKGTVFTLCIPVKLAPPDASLPSCTTPENVIGAQGPSLPRTRAVRSLSQSSTGTVPTISAASLSESPTPRLPASSTPVDPHLPTTKPRRRILVTDDSPMNRKILVRIVKKVLSDRLPPEDVEWIVEEAENGEEAVKKVEEKVRELKEGAVEAPGSDEYAIVFMDVIMPVLDGYEATRRIKALLVQPISDLPAEVTEPALPTTSPGHKHPPLPIIITTANQVSGTAEAEAAWKESGADAAISKPFGREAIEKLLREYCVGF